MEEQLKKIGKRQKPVLPESLQDSKVLALEIVKVAWDRNAYQTKIYDVRKLIDYTDLFVVLSGRSERQVASIADSIQAEMKAAGAIPIGVEGRQSGTWILLDYGSVVVHIFTRDAREYYDLDRLWADAPLVSARAPMGFRFRPGRIVRFLKVDFGKPLIKLKSFVVQIVDSVTKAIIPRRCASCGAIFVLEGLALPFVPSAPRQFFH